jgi:ABC-2 type transport system ATP-binding protein
MRDVSAPDSTPHAVIVEISHLHKTYGSFCAVRDVSFAIQEGEIVGMLGANGAGKSTTILMMLGLISPTSGEVTIFGKSFERHRGEILGRMNFSAPYLTFPGRLTVFENLMVFARLYGIPQPGRKIAELLRLFEIEALRDKPVLLLSSGQNTRVGLCKAFLNDPKLLLLDEPTAYLDPHVSRLVKQALLDLRERCGTAMLYTTHNMAEIEEMCGRVIFLARGEVIMQGTPLELTRAVLKEERPEPALEEVFLRVTESAE